MGGLGWWTRVDKGWTNEILSRGAKKGLRWTTKGYTLPSERTQFVHPPLRWIFAFLRLLSEYKFKYQNL